MFLALTPASASGMVSSSFSSSLWSRSYWMALPSVVPHPELWDIHVLLSFVSLLLVGSSCPLTANLWVAPPSFCPFCPSSTFVKFTILKSYCTTCCGTCFLSELNVQYLVLNVWDSVTLLCNYCYNSANLEIIQNV